LRMLTGRGKPQHNSQSQTKESSVVALAGAA
jgi:hypothetical protein